MKTKIEIIKETVDFYSADTSRRALNCMGGCEYINDEGERCAVGRYMIDPNLWLSRGTIGDVARMLPSNDGRLPTGIVIPECDGHSISFWLDVQSLHDYDGNWNKDGLSICGGAALDTLLNKYKNE
jgi:hypothetical protein